MENLDQGFFASGLDSFDMGVIQNRPWTEGETGGWFFLFKNPRVGYRKSATIPAGLI